MSDSWQERRRAELTAAHSLELLRLVLLYRDARGLDLYEQLPSSLSFAEMIDTVIEHEAAARGAGFQPALKKSISTDSPTAIPG